MITNKAFGVGLVGLRPGSWAAIAHIPALLAQPENFRIAGVANSTAESGERAAEEFGIERAFKNAAELIGSDAVDIVAVNVKIPQHFDIVTAALDAGKNVYCEWALGKTLDEAKLLAESARGKSLHAVIGTQARVAPGMNYVRDLVAEGFVGEVLSTTVVSSGTVWGDAVSEPSSYILDVRNGATMLTISFAHALAAIEDVLGNVDFVSAELATRRRRVRVIETGEDIPMTAPDQVLVIGAFESGAPLSVHYRGGEQRGDDAFRWEINGTKGDLLVTAATGQAQMSDLNVYGGRGESQILEPLPIPQSYPAFPEIVEPARNVALMYRRLASDLRDGTQTAPNFDYAVKLHRLIEAVESAARTGKRTYLKDIA